MSCTTISPSWVSVPPCSPVVACDTNVTLGTRHSPARCLVKMTPRKPEFNTVEELFPELDQMKETGPPNTFFDDPLSLLKPRMVHADPKLNCDGYQNARREVCDG